MVSKPMSLENFDSGKYGDSGEYGYSGESGDSCESGGHCKGALSGPFWMNFRKSSKPKNRNNWIRNDPPHPSEVSRKFIQKGPVELPMCHF